MNKTLITAALAGVITAGHAMTVQAEDMASAKEKCYGITKAGKNACAAANGSHSCAGQASKDNDSHDWTLVAKEECAKDGGSLEPGK